MIAYKGFHKDMTCTMGKGSFRYEQGVTYKEESAKCTNTGFHCTEDPLGCLFWYDKNDDRYFMVRAEGDINEDDCHSKISCTEITLVKELTRVQLAAHACRYMQKYPKRKRDSRYVYEEKGKTEEDFIIVRGKHPVAAGEKGTILFLLQEEEKSTKIRMIEVYEVDGKEIKAGQYYGMGGVKVKCRKKN
ncbi:DUF7666 domain-containing protein [Frisingicoccus sp.]|uniref:DUF7666 domain-containing protein n=1 Tax=Frisingicoccus sp. TaxID=1918627 RepID=UPI003FA5D859